MPKICKRIYDFNRLFGFPYKKFAVDVGEFFFMDDENDTEELNTLIRVKYDSKYAKIL